MKTTCPQCDAVLNVPDHASGKSLKCGNCGTIIPAGNGPLPPRETDSDWISPKGWPKETRATSRAEKPNGLNAAEVATAIEDGMGTIMACWTVLMFIGACCGGFVVVSGASHNDPVTISVGASVVGACIGGWVSMLLVSWIIRLLAIIARK